jgi:hypothetical protein
MTFGKRVGGGRRIAPRMPMEVPASITGLDSSGSAVLADISTSGAKLRAANLPDEGEDFWIKAGPVEVLATVMWKRGDRCGATFDIPLEPFQLHLLRSEASRARFMRVTPEQRMITEDWEGGLAR